MNEKKIKNLVYKVRRAKHFILNITLLWPNYIHIMVIHNDFKIRSEQEFGKCFS